LEASTPPASIHRRRSGIGLPGRPRYCAEPHRRRIRVGDLVAYKSLPFFIDNAAVLARLAGDSFNEHCRWGRPGLARQVVLASYTIAYAAMPLHRDARPSLKAEYRRRS